MDIGQIAIFGIGKAAELAYIFACEANLEVKYFVDDFQSGMFCDKFIVSWMDYAEQKYKECDYLLCGPYQKGDILQRESKKPIKILKMEWFV